MSSPFPVRPPAAITRQSTRHAHGRRKVFAVLCVYLDESGIHAGASMCVLAGFLGSSRQWERFDAAYVRAVGEDANTPGIHASDYFIRDTSGRRTGAYRGWSEDRAERLLTGLVQAVTSVDVWPIVAALDVAAFNTYTAAERQQLTGRHHKPGTPSLSGAPNKPYYLVFQSAVFQAAQRLKRPDLLIDFVFDQQQQFGAYAHELYAYIKRVGLWGVPSKALGDLTFSSRADALPLQAADLLAYCWYQRHARQRESIQPDIEAVLNQWAHKKLEGDFLNRRSMDHLLGKVPLDQSRTYGV